MKAGHGDDDLFHEGDHHDGHAHEHHAHDPLKDDKVLQSMAKVGKIFTPSFWGGGKATVEEKFQASSQAGPADPYHGKRKDTDIVAHNSNPGETVLGGGGIELEDVTVDNGHTHNHDLHASLIDKIATRRLIAIELKKLRRPWQSKLLDMAMLFNAFYLAVFVSNYIYVVSHEDEYNNWIKTGLLLLCITPGMLVFWVCGKVIKTQSILDSMCDIDRHLVGKVIDSTEESLSDGKEIFQQFYNKFGGLKLNKDDVITVFNQIDKDNSGSLDRRELELALFDMGIQLGRKRFKKFFRVIDKDKNGTISLEEFVEMCYGEAA